MSKRPRRHHQGGAYRDSKQSFKESWEKVSAMPPDGLPTYRLITGKDDDAISGKVSEALKVGYRLHGSPAICINGAELVMAQAVVWPAAEYRTAIFDEDYEIPF